MLCYIKLTDDDTRSQIQAYIEETSVAPNDDMEDAEGLLTNRARSGYRARAHKVYFFFSHIKRAGKYRRMVDSEKYERARLRERSRAGAREIDCSVTDGV